jgi:dipeptidyl-peptidase-3
MLKHYITHFFSGNIDDHKNSQREWIKDKHPVIESNIGWIEHYDDP